MSAKVKKLKALLGLNGTSDPDLLKQLNAAHDGMNGNSAFPISPVDMQTFKAGVDKLTVLVTDAEDGGKKAIAAKKKQREEMIKQYTLLGTTSRPPRTMTRQCSTPAGSSWPPRRVLLRNHCLQRRLTGSTVPRLQDKWWSSPKSFRRSSASTCANFICRLKPGRYDPNVGFLNAIAVEVL